MLARNEIMIKWSLYAAAAAVPAGTGGHLSAYHPLG